MSETLQEKCERLVRVAVRREERHRAELEALGVPLNERGEPDCGSCAESRRVNVGLVLKNRQLRDRIAGREVPITDEMVDAAVRGFNGWPADHPIDRNQRRDDRWKAMRNALDLVGRTP